MKPSNNRRSVSQLFCKIGVSQYSQENTWLSFFANIVERWLEPILIKKGAAALVFFWQLNKVFNNFFNTKLTLNESIVARNVDQILIRNLITQLFIWNFDKISIFLAVTAGYTKSYYSKNSLKAVINTPATEIWRFLTCQNCQMICGLYYWDKKHAMISPLIVMTDWLMAMHYF